MCNCHSYNWDSPNSGKDQTVCLTPPEWWNSSHEYINIDECIVDVIKHLWDKKIVTMNSCCGHNRQSPSIIFEDSVDALQANEIRKHIAEVDDRKFKLLVWKLTEI